MHRSDHSVKQTANPACGRMPAERGLQTSSMATQAVACVHGERWSTVEQDNRKRAFALALVEMVSNRGWAEASLSRASAHAYGDPTLWKSVFPGGAQEAIWYISDLADLEMRTAFLDRNHPFPTLSAVILTRLHQNADLKKFVFRLLLVDILHPVRALTRTQRTSRHMLVCMGQATSTFWMRSAITVLYTLVVLTWLVEAASVPSASRRVAHLVSRLVGSS